MATPRAANPEPVQAEYLLKAGGVEPGTRLDLRDGQSCILGRGRGADIRLEDEKASRQHCRITLRDGTLIIEDLKSANGTHLNGEVLERPKALRNNDTIKIGRQSFTVSITLPVSDQARSWWEEKEATVRMATGPADGAGQTEQLMAGSLKSVGVVDLLQLLATAQNSAVLTLKDKSDVGRLYLRDGQVIKATLNERSSLKPDKTAIRLLRWKSGRFELTPLKRIPDGAEITDSTQSLLLAGVQISDEFGELEAQLPTATAKLSLNKPMPVRLRELTSDQLDLVQLILEHEQWMDVMDAYDRSDVDAGRLLVELLQRKIVAAH